MLREGITGRRGGSSGCCWQGVGSDPGRAAGARALLEVGDPPEDTEVFAEGTLLSLTDLIAPARANSGGLLVLRTGARSVVQPLSRAAAASDACAAPSPWLTC